MASSEERFSIGCFLSLCRRPKVYRHKDRVHQLPFFRSRKCDAAVREALLRIASASLGLHRREAAVDDIEPFELAFGDRKPGAVKTQSASGDGRFDEGKTQQVFERVAHRHLLEDFSLSC